MTRAITFSQSSFKNSHAAISQKTTHFGASGLWVSPELAPYSHVGGLGQVTRTIPEELYKHQNHDVRVITPLLKGCPDDTTDTGITLLLKGPGNEEFPTTLRQRINPETGRPEFFIDQPTLFRPHHDLYFPKDKPIEALGQDAMFSAMMFFNRAVAGFLPHLTGKQERPQNSPMIPFKNGLDTVIAHDWLTSPVLNEMEPQIGSLFMFHNSFNESRSSDIAEASFLKEPPVEHGEFYSPLRIGIEKSDAVIAERNYADREAHILSPSADWAEALRQKIADGKCFGVHHGVSNVYNPISTAALASDGFSNLSEKVARSHYKNSPGNIIEIQRFKQTNKAALQNLFPLNPDPNAVIVSWIARPDPYQKGFHLFMNSVDTLLARYPQAQFVIAGPDPEKAGPALESEIRKLLKDYPGRIVFPGFANNTTVTRIHAGSDFLVLPSIYEPFGLSQLEAKMLGSIPIVNGVDGLKTTVSDPTSVQYALAWLHKHLPYETLKKWLPKPEELVWAFGQTGIVIPPIEAHAYWHALNKELKHKTLTGTDIAVLTQTRHNFETAMGRAFALAKNTTANSGAAEHISRIRLNGMRYVNAAHNWDAITELYTDPINAAMKAAKKRRNQKA